LERWREEYIRRGMSIFAVLFGIAAVWALRGKALRT
jgi:hypothetical protein